MSPLRSPLAVLAVGSIFCLPCRADLPSPRFDRLTPLGGTAGAVVEIEIAGSNIEAVQTLLFDHPGFKAEHRKDRRFRVTIADDVPEGTHDVYLVDRFGISNPRLFAVSRGLTEVTKKGTNHDPASAQTIPVNAAVNGMADGNREDVYRFAAKKGQRVVIECQAGKLDSQMDPTLALSTADGKPLASNSDYFGRDPLIDFVAPNDGDYLVNVHDLSFRGNLAYRLLVSDRPHVENVSPRAVQAGQPATLTVFGRNLGRTAKPSAWRIQDLLLDECQQTFPAPPDLLTLGTYRFVEHPTCHGVLPTAATFALTGFQIQPRSDGIAAGAVPLLVVDTPVSLEVEPNDDPSKPQMIQLPAVVSGRFDRPRDADWYEFEAPENGSYAFEVYSERIAGRADPYLVVVDDQGKRLAELDDFGPRVNAFDGLLRDPSGMVNLTGKRRYRVLVQDRYQRGGARFQYVLVVRKPVPDFHVAVIHHQNPGPGGTIIRRGGATHLDVITQRREGFSGPITLTAEGLPPGVHARPTILHDDRGAFVLWADADAADWTGPIQLIATGQRGNDTLRREVRPYTRVWHETNPSSSRPTRELIAAVRESAPFALRFAEERPEVKVKEKISLKLQVDRLWPDAKNTITIQSLAFPNRLRMGVVQAPADKNEVSVTIEVQAGTPPGEYTLAVMGQSQVPYGKDPAAKQKPNTLVSLPSRPLTLVVKP